MTDQEWYLGQYDERAQRNMRLIQLLLAVLLLTLADTVNYFDGIDRQAGERSHDFRGSFGCVKKIGVEACAVAGRRNQFGPADELKQLAGVSVQRAVDLISRALAGHSTPRGRSL